MPWPVHPTGFFGARGDSDTYRIERSLRFNSADSAYLGRTAGTSTDQNICTVSFWLKRVSIGISQRIIEGRTANSDSGYGVLEINSTDKLVIGGFSTNFRITTQVLRDPSSWYHIVAAWDTSQATASNRIKVYLNGVEITSFDTSSNPTQNTTIGMNNNSTVMNIGRRGPSNDLYLSAYLTELNFIDGQALTPSSFGETDAITGRWKAKAYSGTYGANGFYLKFADNSGTTSTTLGKDSSGNGNNWTPNNFSVDNITGDGVGNDSLVDSPTNYGLDTGLGGEVRGNYCTFNPLKRGSTYGNLSNGNLTIASTTGAAGQQTVQANIAISSGKWYAEAIITTVGAESSVGIAEATQDTGNYVGASLKSYGYYFNGAKYNNSTSSTYGSSYTSGDVIGIAFDADLGNLVFYKNGTSQGTAFTGLTSGPYVFEGQGRSATSANNNSWNFGQRPWKYAAPSGFKALCTQNLPQPTIQNPSKYMDASAYTGTGASNSISSLGFSPDLVWIKNRGTTTDHALYDTTRGTQAQISSNSTAAEVTSSSGLTAFDSAGFTIGTSSLVNTSGTQYVAWSWDESAKSGLDIVGYVGDGSAGKTISHNLGVAPKMIIVKNRTTGGFDWVVYHQNMNASPQGGYLGLNATYAFQSNTTIWNNTAPSSSVFTLGTNTAVNKSGDNHIAYCFAEIEGYSKFGSYTGNNSADGPFIWCGFRPRWVIIKRIDANAKPWCIHDTGRDISNVSNSELEANSSTAENGGTYPGDLDILSNGFKLREAGTGAWINEPGNFIFAAFAEAPFKYARAR